MTRNQTDVTDIRSPQHRRVTVAAVRSCDCGIHGPEKLILDLESYLHDSGFRYLVVNLWDGRPPVVELHEVALERGLESRVLYAAWDYNPLMALKLRQLLVAEGVDVIHTYGEKAEVWSYVASRGIRCRLLGSYYGRVSMGSRKVALHQSTSLFTLRLFDLVLANSNAQREELLKYGHCSSKIEVVPSYVDLREFTPLSDAETLEMRKALGISPEARVIATVARLHPEKGHAMFLDAMAALRLKWPELMWLVVGDGPLLSMLSAKAHRLALDNNVLFMGYRSDLRSILGACEFVVSPSLREGMSVALLDSMAMAKPVVATAVGGSVEVVRTRKTGYLVDREDTAGLVAAVDKLLSCPTSIGRMGRNARRLVQRNYSMGVVCAQIGRKYEEMAHWKTNAVRSLDSTHGYRRQNASGPFSTRESTDSERN